MLVFPKIVKAGFLLGRLWRRGAAAAGGRIVLGYYNSAAASYGLQAGVQWFGYALFLFMNANALKYLDQSQGWEIGVGAERGCRRPGHGKKVHFDDGDAGCLCGSLSSTRRA